MHLRGRRWKTGATILTTPRLSALMSRPPHHLSAFDQWKIQDQGRPQRPRQSPRAEESICGKESVLPADGSAQRSKTCVHIRMLESGLASIHGSESTTNLSNCPQTMNHCPH